MGRFRDGIHTVEIVADETGNTTGASSNLSNILQQHRVGEAQKLDGMIGGGLLLHKVVPSRSGSITRAKDDEDGGGKGTRGERIESGDERGKEDFLDLLSAVGDAIDAVTRSCAVGVELDDKAFSGTTREERSVGFKDGGGGARMGMGGLRRVAKKSKAEARAENRATADESLLGDSNMGIIRTEPGKDEDDGGDGNV